VRDEDDAFQAMAARLAVVLPRLNERDRRLAMATEAKSWGRGGIAAVHRATGSSRSTIRRGLTELDNNTERTRIVAFAHPVVAAGKQISPTRSWQAAWMH
jgi:hypothetical protein